VVAPARVYLVEQELELRSPLIGVWVDRAVGDDDLVATRPLRDCVEPSIAQTETLDDKLAGIVSGINVGNDRAMNETIAPSRRQVGVSAVACAVSSPCCSGEAVCLFWRAPGHRSIERGPACPRLGTGGCGRGA